MTILGHFCLASQIASPVFTPYFFVGILLASIMPCLVACAPATADGISLKSTAAPCEAGKQLQKIRRLNSHLYEKLLFLYYSCFTPPAYIVIWNACSCKVYAKILDIIQLVFSLYFL